MRKFLMGVKDGFLGGNSAGEVDETPTPRIGGGNAAASFGGTRSYQKLLEASKVYDAKVLKFFKKTLPIIFLVVGLLMLIPFTYQDYTLRDGIEAWLMVMFIMSLFVVLPVSAALFPSSDNIEQSDIDAVVAENRNKLKDFYGFYVNNTLNDGLPSNEKVNIKPTNFKATASSIGRSNDAVTKNHKIKLVGMYQIEDKLTVVTVYLKFSKGYEELFVYEHDVEVFDPT